MCLSSGSFCLEARFAFVKRDVRLCAPKVTLPRTLTGSPVDMLDTEYVVRCALFDYDIPLGSGARRETRDLASRLPRYALLA